MYGINGSVHTTLCPKISLLVFNVHAHFIYFLTFWKNATKFYFSMKHIGNFLQIKMLVDV